ncbi:MAG: HAMP domain-containing histidine kinase [Actinobacteria bacterium]|nr:HAMP domain-containing histidine kinase [Actinomycetota bacterium]
MQVAAPVLLVVLAAGCVLLAVWLVTVRRELADARTETEHLRELVKKRVERPNVFSHEVRTPLTLIKGAAELLAEETPGPLTARQREFVDTIAGNADQVISLAQDLLTEARLDSPLFDLHLDRLDLRRLVRQTVRDARRVHPNPIRLDNAGAPLLLLADRALLGQALWNLLNNACRHAGTEATLTVSASRGEGQAVLAVSDDGAGMTPEERQGLFVPFAGNAEMGGAGLGMMITERIIAQHDGHLLVDTIPGRGTTVFITLPLAERTEPDHD